MSSQHKVYAWGDSWFKPIIDCMYRGDRDGSALSLEQARQALPTSALSAGERRAAEFRLDYYAFQIRYIFDDKAGRSAAYEEFLSRTAARETEPTAEIQRAIVRLLAGAALGRDGVREVPRYELEPLLRSIPEAERRQELWHGLAGWAFRGGHKDLLELAYEGTLLKPSGFLSDYSWRRANLMLLLMEERASEVDVLALVREIRARPHFNEFQAMLWPAIEHAGLATPRVVECVQHTDATLSENGHTVPKRTRKTQSVRTESLEEFTDLAPS